MDEGFGSETLALIPATGSETVPRLNSSGPSAIAPGIGCPSSPISLTVSMVGFATSISGDSSIYVNV